MKTFRAFNTPTIYLNTSKIRVLIQITLCRNTRTQTYLSKNNRFSAEKRKKVPVCETLEFSWSLSYSMIPILSWKITAHRISSTIPPSSKFELLCQYEINSIVTKSSIWESNIRLCFVCFLCKTLTKRLKLKKLDIYMFKDKKKATRTRCAIYPELAFKAPRQR